MKRFPLGRTVWSNEKIMALLCAVLVLWQVPSWLSEPALAGSRLAFFAVLLAVSLVLDVACNLIRFKRFLCSVSAAVTAGVVAVLAPLCVPFAPLWLVSLALAIALIAGKHLAGGTGKNALNPALLALALLSIAGVIMGNAGPESFLSAAVRAGAYPGPVGPFSSALAVSLIVLSLPFMLMRPFAALAFLAGSGIAWWLGAQAGSWFPLASLSFFVAGVVLTDPVTVTRHPVAGAIGGAAAGVCFVLLPVSAFPLIVLAVNAVSFAVDRFLPPFTGRGFIRLKKPVRFVAASVGSPASGESIPPTAGVADLSAEAILAKIRDANIEGRGGAGFPAHVKIETFLQSESDRKLLIVNGTECDPGLVHDKWLISNRGAEIACGMSAVMKACGIPKAILAVKRATPVPFALPEGVRLARVPDRYPVGAERILVRLVTGTALDPVAIPAREGFLVFNVQTIYAIGRALAGVARHGDSSLTAGAPAGERFITVADLASKTARVVAVARGERVADIADREFPGTGPVFVGGGFMQAFRAGDADVVDRATNFIARAKAPDFRESPQCSRCGRCLDVCPAALDVRAIASLVDAGKLDAALALGAGRCLSCGSCSVVCLAGKNLSQRVSLAGASPAAREA